MRVDLSRLIDRTVYKIDLDRKIDIGLVKTNDREIDIKGPVRISGSIYKTDEGYFLDSNIEYEYTENCARCLKKFTNKIEAVLSGRLVEEKAKRIVEQEDNDEQIIYHDGDEIFLEESILTSLLLSLPMKSLCDVNCKGLCKSCGKDLNIGACSCSGEDIDPRLAKLKELFD